MVEKKLNYNQPILSVRRYSHKADDLLHPGSGSGPGPIRNPGAVPFQWERAPGQPKELLKQPKIEATDSDEADSLSRSTESFVSSSRSSLTGIEDQDPDASRRFSEDPQSHEVAMDTEKKRSSEARKEIVSQDKAAFWYRPTFAKTCSGYKDKDDDDEDDRDRDRNENLIAVCCVLPRSCLKSSVCVLNPLPAAFDVRPRLTVFQGMQCASSSTDSSSETEDTVKSAAGTDELKEKKSNLPEERKHAIGSRSRSFKTLQELLEDEDYRRRKGVNNVEKKQQITTLAHFPLPRSPSDSWLCRTLPSVRASNPAFASRFTSKS